MNTKITTKHIFILKKQIYLCLLLVIPKAFASDLYHQNLNDVQVSIILEDVTITEVFSAIEKKTNFTFVFDNTVSQTKKHFSISAQNKSLKSILKNLASHGGFEFKRLNNIITVVKVENLQDEFQQAIRGRVIDEAGLPLPGATVVEQGTNNGTQTNFEGEFQLEVSSDSAILEVSFMGFKTKEINTALRSSEVIDIVLEQVSNELSEVVLVSYGTQKNREVTGSISTVEATGVLEDQPVGQFAQQLQGQVAGLQINQANGQPGRGMTIQIRGAASMFASNEPLFVIDGMPITGGINNINPQEIESFTVLKDASATALYGSRAANGVILITTKHAKPGENRIEFNSFYGMQEIPQNLIPDLMNAQEFAQFQKEIHEDRVRYEGFTGDLDPVYENPQQYGEGTNWFKTLTRTAPIQSYNLSVFSGNEKSSSTVTAGYFNQEGVVINTNTERFSIRLNQDFRFFNDRLRTGFNVAPSYRIDHNVRLGTQGLEGIVQHAMEASPLIDPVNPDGTMPLFVNSPRMVNTINPYAYMTEIKDDYKTTRILGNTYLEYDLINDLTLRTNLGVDKGADNRNRFVPSTIVSNGIANGLSSAVDNYSWTAETTLQYRKTFWNTHNIEALIGYSVQKYDSESQSVEGTNFPNDEVEWLNAATSITGGGSNTTSYSLLSEIARLNYNYKSKYLLSGAIRRDGSSRFGSDEKYGYFPSLSLGWLLSEESFLNRVDKVNMLKLRASYGITGNNNIGNYTHISNTSDYNYVFNGELVPGTTISTLGNSDLAWERNKQFDIGLDMSLFNNRVSFTYDYYHKITDGMIMDRQIPEASGFSTIKYNVGEFEFWGHEMSLNTVNISGELEWNSNFNISFNRNKINSLVAPGFIRRNNTTTSDYYRHQEGHSIGEFYGFIYDGLYQNEEDLANSPQVQWKNWYSAVGSEKMRDVSGPEGVPDGIIDENDRTFIGDPTPDFTFGFTNEFKYRNFDLGIIMTGSVGGKVFNASRLYLTNMYGNRMVLKEVADRWRSPENPGTGLPRSMTNTHNIHNQVNSRFVEDGSHLTVKNITLGYTIEPTRNLLMQKLRVYASVQQAFILTNYSGMNPEVNHGGNNPTNGVGLDANSYPVPRTFSLGVSATFK